MNGTISQKRVTLSPIDPSKLTAINRTALLVALRRAAESKRQDALFRDALAEAVADLLPGPLMSPEFWLAAREMAELSGDAVALRTRHFDDQIHNAVRHGVRQVVMLGVGLDGRSHRLNLDPGTQFFEVDQPAVLSARQALLHASNIEPKYRTSAIPADFSNDDLLSTLRAAGFRPSAPSICVAEGLVFYLRPADIERLLSEIGFFAAPGSLLLADFPANHALNMTDDGDEPVVTADFNKDHRGDPWTLFESANWLLECRTLTNLARTFGRPLPVEIDESRGGARWWYARAIRV